MLDTDTVRALVDVGFIALSRGLDRHAEAIFQGVAAARPEHETGPLGLALVALLRGDPALAVKLLKPLPPSDQVQVFLGMALMRHGDREEARAVLDRLMATTSDPAIIGLAADLRTGG
jgi:hypothetical protein